MLLGMHAICLHKHHCKYFPAEELDMNGHTAQEDGPVDHTDADLNGAMLESDQAMDQAEGQPAAEAPPEVPAIPAEIPAEIILPRLADRSAVTAPSDAIGELV